MLDIDELAGLILNGNKRAIARGISLIENYPEEGKKLIKHIFPKTGNAHIIGVTGPPGSGKSTLVNALATAFSKDGVRVGIIAVDPTSPFSGGALLGDRIRMTHAEINSSIFIRSMGSRGSLGGLSRSTIDAVRILDAAGFNKVIVETVGAGQSEVDIMRCAHTTLVLGIPGAGDAVQAIKAGIMEIADILVVNKTDQPDAAKYVHTLEKMIHDLSSNRAWIPPIIKTIALQNQGIEKLMDKVYEHMFFLQQDEFFVHQRKKKIRREIIRLAEQKIRREMNNFLEDNLNLDATLKEVAIGRKDPYSIAEEMVGIFLKSLRES